jgi:hypothetical protein
MAFRLVNRAATNSIGLKVDDGFVIEFPGEDKFYTY